MRNLNRRLRALESKQHGEDLPHLTDEELIARLVLVCEQIEEMGGQSQRAGAGQSRGKITIN
jgi:hypothetical protein